MKALSFILVILAPLFVAAQTAPTIHFDSSEESNHFQDYSQDKTFDLLYAINHPNYLAASAKGDKEEFFLFLSNLKKEMGKKKRTKAITLLYDKIHDEYFGKYILNPLFSDIFESREYNCVTATALYAIALEYFSIPYEIRETPDHVYLIAYPADEKIILESTTPDYSLKKISQKEIEKLRRSLIANKVVTEQESKSDSFIENYYLSDGSITLKELVAVQYYNRAIKHAEDQNKKETINLLEKAHAFYPSEYITMLFNLHLTEVIDNHAMFSNDEFCESLSKVIHYNSGKINKLRDAYTSIYSFKLTHDLRNRRAGNLDSLHHCVISSIADDKTITSFEEVYHLSFAEYHFYSADNRKTLSHLKKIAHLEKENINFIIKAVLISQFNTIANPIDGLDSLAKYAEIFPIIKKDKDILGFKTWCLLKIIYTHFELDERDKGIDALDQFREAYKPQDDITYDESMIGSAFGSFSSYWVRNKENEKARDALIEGLKYSGYSLQLKRKLKMLYETYPELNIE